MALKTTNYHLENGLVAPTVYVKVEVVSGNTSSITADVKIYVSKEAVEAGIPFIAQQSYTFRPDLSEESQNYHAQSYEFLKKLNEFENAVDV